MTMIRLNVGDGHFAYVNSDQIEQIWPHPPSGAFIRFINEKTVTVLDKPDDIIARINKKESKFDE